MSMETRSSGHSRTWSRRRLAGTALGLAVVVGSAAAANASAHGDGFLSPGAAPAGPVVQANRQAPAQGGHMDPSTTWTPSSPATAMPGDGHRTAAPTTTMTDRDHDRGTAMQGGGWTWTGHGGNTWGFRTVVDPADRTFNQALGVNNNGKIVGYFGSGKDDMHPNKGWSTKGDGAFKDINYPGAMQTQAVGINDDGTVVGFYVKGNGSNHGFVRWQGHYMTVDAPWTSSHPSVNQLLGISRNGIAAGFSNDAKGNAHGYLFDTRTHRFAPVRLPWGATSVTVTGVNDDGTVVGFAMVKKVTVGFVVNRHTALVIKLGDKKNTQALGVNRKGVVVGSFEDRNGMTRGFVWDRGSLRTVDAPHATSTVVNGLNDGGWIVGFFEDGKGNTKGFLARR